MKEQNPIWNDPREFIKDHYEEGKESEEVMKKPTFVDLFELAEKAKKKEDEKLLRELVSDVLSAAKNYNKAREKTKEMSADEKGGVTSSEVRRISHERLLDSINILERNCKRLGVDSSWRERVGEDRKKIGDWAVEQVAQHTEH